MYIPAAPLNALAFNGMQVNGSMEISQENGGNPVTPVSGTDSYVVDGSVVGFHSTSGLLAINGQQVLPPGSPPFGAAFQKCFQISSPQGAALQAADYAGMHHVIEGYRFSRCGFGSAAAAPVTVGWWTYATVPGTMALSLRNETTARSYVLDVTLQGLTWEWHTATIPGDVTGTWRADNGIGAYVNLMFGCGSQYQGTSGQWQNGNKVGTAATTNFFATTANIVCFTGLLVLPGSDAPSQDQSPLIMRPADQEIALCQRTYEKTYDLAVLPGTASSFAGLVASTVSGNYVRFDVRWKVRKRATPVVRAFSPNSGTIDMAWDSQANADIPVLYAFPGEHGALVYGAATDQHGCGIQCIADCRL